MRRLFAALLIWLALAAPAFAAIGTPVEIGFANTSSTTATVITTTASIAAHDSLLVACASDSGTTISSVTDAGSNTYKTANTNASPVLQAFWVSDSAAISSSSSITTSTWSGTGNHTCRAVKIPGGMVLSDMSDQRCNVASGALCNSTTGTSSANTPISTVNSGGLAQPNELIFGIVMMVGTSGGFTANGSWTALTSRGSVEIDIAYQFVTTNGTSIAWAPQWVTNSLSYRSKLHAFRGLIATTNANFAGLGIGN